MAGGPDSLRRPLSSGSFTKTPKASLRSPGATSPIRSSTGMPYSRAESFGSRLEAISTRRRWTNPYCGATATLSQRKFMRASSLRDARQNARRRAHEAVELHYHSTAKSSSDSSGNIRSIKAAEVESERSLHFDMHALWREQSRLTCQRSIAPVEQARASVEAERNGVQNALAVLHQQAEEEMALSPASA